MPSPQKLLQILVFSYQEATIKQRAAIGEQLLFEPTRLQSRHNLKTTPTNQSLHFAHHVRLACPRSRVKDRDLGTKGLLRVFVCLLFIKNLQKSEGSRISKEKQPW